VHHLWILCAVDLAMILQLIVLDVVREMLFLEFISPLCQMQPPADRDLCSVVQRDFNMYLCAAFTMDENFPYLLSGQVFATCLVH